MIKISTQLTYHMVLLRKKTRKTQLIFKKHITSRARYIFSTGVKFVYPVHSYPRSTK